MTAPLPLFLSSLSLSLSPLSLSFGGARPLLSSRLVPCLSLLPSLPFSPLLLGDCQPVPGPLSLLFGGLLSPRLSLLTLRRRRTTAKKKKKNVEGSERGRVPHGERTSEVVRARGRLQLAEEPWFSSRRWVSAARLPAVSRERGSEGRRYRVQRDLRKFGVSEIRRRRGRGGAGAGAGAGAGEARRSRREGAASRGSASHRDRDAGVTLPLFEHSSKDGLFIAVHQAARPNPSYVIKRHVKAT